MREIIGGVPALDFVRVFGIIILVVAALVAALCVIIGYFMRLKQLEKQVDEFKTELNAELRRFEEETKQDFAKERHIINESLAGISETLMRAVLTVGKKDDKSEK